MNSPNNIPNAGGSGLAVSAGTGLKDLDATLHLLAKLPVPAGLEDRVFAGVLSSPRKGRLLEFPRRFYARDWVRSVAAAAIVLAVGGGGWGIYARVEPNQPARLIATPRPIFQPGGFSSAEMIRRPQTLNGPVVKKVEPAASVEKKSAESTTAKKPVAPASKARSAAKSRTEQAVKPAK